MLRLCCWVQILHNARNINQTLTVEGSYRCVYMGVSKNRDTSKMDGESNGKPYEQMDDLGGKPLFSETPIYLEPKLGPLFWLEFRPCFEGLTFKNRGHGWVLGI